MTYYNGEQRTEKQRTEKSNILYDIICIIYHYILYG